MIEVTFTNQAPEDKEWTAHIKLLNDWTEPDRYLRSIIQYARSGPHYPADMHVDLIEQVMAAKERELLYDLDEIENKPWRVFRQLAKIMPEYANTYTDYEAFYSYGGGSEVQQLIGKFKETDDYKESGFPPQES